MSAGAGRAEARASYIPRMSDDARIRAPDAEREPAADGLRGTVCAHRERRELQ